MSSNSFAVNRRAFIKAAALGLTAGPELLARSSPSETPRAKPNILLLMTDQHRGDCLGCDGHPVIQTPHLDRIAREGVRFSSAYSATPTCTPARTALLTGLSPWRHGMLGYGKVSNEYPVKLPQALRDAGYYTYGIGKMHWSPQRSLNGFFKVLLDESGRRQDPGFISDYHQWFETQMPGKDPAATGIGWNDHRAKAYVWPEEVHPTSWTGQMALEFLQGYVRPEPFFLKVSFARPHSPYDPPARFMDLYEEGQIPAPHIGPWAERYAPLQEPFVNDLWHGDLGLDQARRSRRGYYGSITFIDEQIGKILRCLEEKGLLDNTLILVTADHGDMTGDHHLWRKSYAYEASARIPFLVRWPASMGLEDKRGTTLKQPVEIRDVLPTFLDAAGAISPVPLDGRSVMDLVRGKPWRETIDLEHDICYGPENSWNALTDGRMKYIFHAHQGQEQLFDLEEDPGEIRDLAQEKKRVLKAWRERMVEHLEERGEPFVKDGQLLKRSEGFLYGPNYPGA